MEMQRTKERTAIPCMLSASSRCLQISNRYESSIAGCSWIRNSMDQFDGCEAEDARSDALGIRLMVVTRMQPSKEQAQVSGAVQLLLSFSCNEKQRTESRTTSNYVWCSRMFVDAAWQPHTTSLDSRLLAGGGVGGTIMCGIAHLAPVARSPNHHSALDHAYRCAAAATFIHPHYYYTTN